MWDNRKYSLVVRGRPTLTLRARVGRPRTTSSYLRSSHILGWFSYSITCYSQIVTGDFEWKGIVVDKEAAFRKKVRVQESLWQGLFVLIGGITCCRQTLLYRRLLQMVQKTKKLLCSCRVLKMALEGKRQ